MVKQRIGHRQVSDAKATKLWWLGLPRSAALALGSLALGALTPLASGVAHAEPSAQPPDILVITVDTLRADRVSAYGYERETSPNLDGLIHAGVRFDAARTTVALTCPSMASMITTLDPHDHGSSRNGLRIRQGLPSFPRLLTRQGYSTAALVSNWTLKDRLCGLAEHFTDWQEILLRRRLVFGRREANAEDVTDEAIAWLQTHAKERGSRPYFLWVHYVEPHFPYRLQREFLDQLDLGGVSSTFSPRDRYDTEIAFADRSIGRLLEAVDALEGRQAPLTLFTADHGESLGHHGYWGHGRHVYDAGLHIPMSITWRDYLEPGTIEAPAMITDIAVTLFSLAGLPPSEFLQGFDWTPVIRGQSPEPMDRVTFHQAHRGTVKPTEEPVALRRRGLLEVARVQNQRKEVFVVRKKWKRVFDLESDPGELSNLVVTASSPSAELQNWLKDVQAGLESSDSLPPPVLDGESVEKLRALGYLE